MDTTNTKGVRHYVHYIISVYLVFGGIISIILKLDVMYLMIHFYITFLVIIHWLTNNDKCFLSEVDYGEGDGYTNHLLEITLGIKNLTPVQSKILAYSSVYIPCLYSLYQLNKRNIHPYLIL